MPPELSSGTNALPDLRGLRETVELSAPTGLHIALSLLLATITQIYYLNRQCGNPPQTLPARPLGADRPRNIELALFARCLTSGNTMPAGNLRRHLCVTVARRDVYTSKHSITDCSSGQSRLTVILPWFVRCLLLQVARRSERDGHQNTGEDPRQCSGVRCYL